MIQITSGRIATAIKVVVYGPEGIGKSTFAAQFPDPVFIDTEGSTVHMDVKRLPRPDLWVELLNEVEYVRQNPGCCKTLVLDTADWAETLCSEYVCSRDQKTGIEDYGYGKGYRFLFEEFGRLLNALEQVRETGVNIVICCHATMRKFEQPDELGAYDRWSLKLTDTPKASIAGAVKEWADMVIFANYKTIVVNVDGKGAAKGKNKVQGGKRVMYTAHHSCWDAKNRFGLPEEAEFSYEVIRGVIEGSAAEVGGATRTSSVSGEAAATFPKGEGKGEPKQESPSALARAVERAATEKEAPKDRYFYHAESDSCWVLKAGEPMPNDIDSEISIEITYEDYLKRTQTTQPAQASAPTASAADAGAMYAGLPPALARMMQEAQVTPKEVKYVIAQKGIYPADTPWAVIVQNQQFMQGWLLHPQVWPKVVEAVRGNREEVPF